ncbi:MAG: Zn-ribbon domain-containing OB-fold protein [Candidatus Heimdallarchaeota archaeon]|nr:Zn-ribbon domain-containing OB-fold protein [Candidatus Heimdallarchaeota archaeon]
MSAKFGVVSIEDYSDLMQQFATNLLSGKFAGTKCKACGEKYFPPQKGCSECYASDMEEFSMPTEATLVGWTVIHFAPDNMADKAPYVAAIGEFEPGLRVLAHLTGIMAKPKIGMKMKFKMQKVDDTRVYYKFTP